MEIYLNNQNYERKDDRRKNHGRQSHTIPKKNAKSQKYYLPFSSMLFYTQRFDLLCKSNYFNGNFTDE